MSIIVGKGPQREVVNADVEKGQSAIDALLRACDKGFAYLIPELVVR
jgi:hypothetical protein